MLEYAVVAGALLGEKVKSLLNFDFPSGYASILIVEMLEYPVVAGALLGEKVKSLLNLDSPSGYASILIAGVVLAGLGYLIKGLWGSFIALLFGAFIFLYLKDFFPF